MKLELRIRQQWAIHKLYEAMRAGYKKILFVMPTGAGKRYCALWLCQEALKHGRRVLFVTKRRLLVQQMFEGAEDYGVEYSIIMAGEDSGEAPIQIASLQTLQSRYTHDRLGIPTPDRLPPANLVIIDEAHQQVAAYMALVAMYENNPTVVGLTATPVGPEGCRLLPPYECMVEGCLNSELIKDGLLLPTRVIAPSEPGIEGVSIQNGEYNQAALGRKVKECTVFADVFKEWVKWKDRAGVAFVPGIPYGKDLEDQFNFLLGSGSAKLIHAKTKHPDRNQAFDDVVAGRTKLLISCDVLREGFDLPELSLGLDLQPNNQLRSYWQKVGRIKRAHGDQKDAILLDFAGNYWKFPHPDEDPQWPSDEQTSTQQLIEQGRKERGDPQPFMCPGCGEVRSSGKTCPRCGYECGEPIRRIRMGDGRLVEVPLHDKRKREKTEREIKMGKWQSCLFAGLHAGMTFGQCAQMYQRRVGDFPDGAWPGVWPASDLNWRRRVGDCFDKRGLAVGFREAKENDI